MKNTENTDRCEGRPAPDGDGYIVTVPLQRYLLAVLRHNSILRAAHIVLTSLESERKERELAEQLVTNMDVR